MLNAMFYNECVKQLISVLLCMLWYNVCCQAAERDVPERGLTPISSLYFVYKKFALASRDTAISAMESTSNVAHAFDFRSDVELSLRFQKLSTVRSNYYFRFIFLAKSKPLTNLSMP